MKRKLTSIAAAALILGTMAPAAFAASGSSYTDITSQYSWAAQDINNLTSAGVIHGFSDNTYRPAKFVTRGQLLAYFWNLVNPGVKPVANAQYFSDVAPGNWDFNYVGAAYNAGWINQYWINVRPGYAFHLNFHASWGDAASFAVAYMKQNSTTFTTNGMAPLAWAKANGLFQGIPSTENQTYLDRASAAVFLANVEAFMKGQLLPAGATVTVVPANTSESPNSSDTLSVAVKLADGSTYTLPSTASVSYSVDNANGFINGSNLVVTTAGTYNVVATVDGVQSQPVAINVFGQATGIKVTPATTSVVANGAGTDTVTVNVVDANGNTVGNFNGTVDVADSAGWLANSVGANVNSLTAVAVTNGVATFTVNSPMTAGLSDTVTVNNVTPTGGSAMANVSATTTLTSVAQVATSVYVTPASKYLADNTSSTDAVTVTVVDQTGNPMLWGSFPVNVTIAGNGNVNGLSTYSSAYIGNGLTTNPGVQFNVSSVQGVGGTITVTAASGTLKTGTASIDSVLVGAPAAVTATLASGDANSFVAGSSTAYDLQTVDANGYPVTGGSYTTSITDSTGAASTGVTASINSTTGVMTVNGTAAGTYNITVSSGTLKTATVQVTVTASTPAKVAFTTPANNATISMANPTLAVTAQIEDQYGNAVAESGVPVEFTATQVTNVAGAVYSFNGVSNSKYTATTNASGQATVTFASQSTSGLKWSIGIDSVNGVAPTTAVVPVQLSVVGLPVSTMSVQAVDNNQITNYAKAGDTVTFTVYEKDAYGNYSPNGDTINVAIPAGMSATNSSNVNISGLNYNATTGAYSIQMGTATPNQGEATFKLIANSAGGQTVTLTDLTNAASTISQSITESITAGSQSKASFYNASGLVSSSNMVTVGTTGQLVPVVVEPTDAQGNLALSNSNLYYTLVDPNGGQFYTSPSGGVPVTSVEIPAGQASVTLYYTNAAGSYDNFSVNTLAAPAAGTTTVTGNTYTFSFNEAVSVASLSLSELTLSGSATFGTGATLTPNSPVNGYALSFTVTGGTGANVPTTTTMTIPSGDVVNGAGETATGTNVTFTF